jgi:hypothetical protein
MVGWLLYELWKHNVMHYRQASHTSLLVEPANIEKRIISCGVRIDGDTLYQLMEILYTNVFVKYNVTVSGIII